MESGFMDCSTSFKTLLKNLPQYHGDLYMLVHDIYMSVQLFSCCYEYIT